MTQNKKNFKKHSLVGSGARAVALAFAALPLFALNQDAAAQAPNAPYPAAANAQGPVAPAIQAPAPQVPATQAPAQYSPLAAAPQQGPYGPAANASARSNAEELPALRERAQALQAQLQRMPTTLAEQQEQQQAHAELMRLQAQIQQLEAASHFSVYRQERLQALDESGLNTGAAAMRTDLGPGLTPGEVAMLREQKAGLLQQYNQIQQTLRALQPGDSVLADNLKQEQGTIAAQLRDIDQRLSAAPQASVDAQQSLQTLGVAPFVVPPTNQLTQAQPMQDPGANISARMQLVNQATQLLRQAGLVQLANHASNEVPRLADPNYAETQLVPGSWAEGDGIAEARNNPFKQVGAKDIEQINTKIDDLATRVESLAQTLADVETQLKLLTRNSVGGSLTAPPENAALLQEFAPVPIDSLDDSNFEIYGEGFSAPPGSVVPEGNPLPPIPGEDDIDAPEGSDEAVPESV
jgi:hypothetical protein